MSQNIRNVILTGTFTRPSNASGYTAQDVVSTQAGSLITLAPITDGDDTTTGQSFIIKTARLETNNATVTNGTFRLYIYRSNTDVTPIADNSPYTLLTADKAKRVGYIDFTLATAGSGSDSAEAFVADANIAVRATSGDIYGVLVATGAYTPSSAQVFYIELHTHQLDK